MYVYFISCHDDLTDVEFVKHYIPVINSLIDTNAWFILSDTDKLAQLYLSVKVPKETVTIYHVGDSPKTCLGFPTKGGYTSVEQRDEQMTMDSTGDILWIRPGSSVNRVENNMKRRKLYR